MVLNYFQIGITTDHRSLNHRSPAEKQTRKAQISVDDLNAVRAMISDIERANFSYMREKRGVSDFVSIVAEKKATIPPKSGRSYRLDQGFTALATKMAPLWGFGIR